MGGRDHAFRFVSLLSSASPEKEYSWPPTKRAILLLAHYPQENEIIEMARERKEQCARTKFAQL